MVTMVYTDGIHLVADTESELHEFATDIGLNRSWYHNERHKYYDLVGASVKRAIAAGAELKNTRYLVALKSLSENRSKLIIV